MQLRLFIDEDAMSRAVAHNLRMRGIDLTTVVEEQREGLDDAAQLDCATSQARALYTFNVRDFYQLHTEYLAQGKSHAGIILAMQQRYSVGEQVRRLLRLIRVKSAEAMHNEVEFLSHW
jgi:hypothetical protein